MNRSRRPRRSLGQGLVEFALVMPVFALLLFGLLDLGRIVYIQHTVTQAAREAARQAAVGADESSAKYSAIRQAALASSPGTGITSADIFGQGCADCFYPSGPGSGGRAVVNISTSVQLVTPIIGQLVGGTINVTAHAVGFIP